MEFCNFLFLWHRLGIRIKSCLYLPSLSERCCDGAQVQLQLSLEVMERRGSDNNINEAICTVLDIASLHRPSCHHAYCVMAIVRSSIVITFSLYRTSIWLIDCLFYCFTSSQQYFSHITAASLEAILNLQIYDKLTLFLDTCSPGFGMLCVPVLNSKFVAVIFGRTVSIFLEAWLFFILLSFFFFISFCSGCGDDVIQCSLQD